VNGNDIVPGGVAPPRECRRLAAPEKHSCTDPVSPL